LKIHCDLLGVCVENVPLPRACEFVPDAKHVHKEVFDQDHRKVTVGGSDDLTVKNL
jgi:hypothetical protein